MSWSMPTTGQWNPGMAVTPDMNMGSYTPEQWALMQQQNWQQWAQWQQQYAQWQSQYGDKYTQQMQAMQTMAGPPPIPPPSSAAPPPAPPPEKPPPPPHENDQPLYGNTHKLSTTIQPPAQTYNNSQAAYNNITVTTGNNQNWPYDADPKSDPQQLQSVNTEDLKKLAEEERLFDIQFKKWEEEIDKWKKENVNHPDKQAYKEYEQKFESCRVQLLERRQQMKLKRARLMGNVPQASNNITTGNIATNIPPPPLQNTNLNNYSQNVHQSKQNQQNKPPAKSHMNQNVQQHSQYHSKSQQGYNRNNITITPQDNYDAYPPENDAYTNAPSQPTNSNFLPSSQSKGIPGLDLVPEMERSTINKQDVIDITEEQRLDENHQQQKSMEPDYSKISKGINNILGDEKIMNILSMVSNQMPPGAAQNPSGHYRTPGGNDVGQSVHGQYRPTGGNDTNHNMGGNYRPPGGNDGSQSVGGHYRPGGNDAGQYRHPGGNSAVQNTGGYFRPGGHDAAQNAGGHYKQNDNQWDRNNSNYQNIDYDNRQQMPYKQNIVHNYSDTQGQMNSDQATVPHQRYDDNYTRDGFRHNDMSQDPYYDNHTKDVPTRSGPPPARSNMLPPRPLIPNLPSQANSSEYSPGGFEGRPLPNIINRSLIQQPKPKWVDEPLFAPSIIVDYEHKPLRLKARDFIEPVHTFDYNHKSKDGESSHKKDFEKEIDDLFTRKPRKVDINEDWNNSTKKYLRDRSKQSTRDDYDNMYNRRPDNHYEDRRREERNRFAHEDYERRDRGPDYDRSRDYGRDKDLTRDMGRGWDVGRDRDPMRERDPIRERDVIRDRDPIRSRDPIRDRDIGRNFRDTVRDREFGRDRDVGREREPMRDRVEKERDNGRDRDFGREREAGRYRDIRRDDSRNRSRSRDIDSRKREHSKDNDSISSSGSKKTKESKEDTKTPQSSKPQHIVMIDDLLEPPGRDMRPTKMVIILRGAPGSGKSYLAKLIRDKEAEHGGTVRIMSIDDYFMQEGEIEEKDPNTGKIVKKPSLKYEYDEKSEETYLTSLKRAFKRSLTDGYFSFLIFDAVNDQLKSYADIWNFARQSGFQVYICTMEMDIQTCFKRNIHGRKLEDIEVIVSRFFPTPNHHIQLDATTLLQNASIPDVQMEDAEDVTMEDAGNTEVDSSFTSKWEKMDDAAQLARLDGTNKPLRPSQLSMEDYLQLDDWTPNIAKPGKKTVRWADIEERRQQEKMRAIGFVVGQTDWNRMTDPTMGSSALTQTKYIERVRRF